MSGFSLASSFPWNPGEEYNMTYDDIPGFNKSHSNNYIEPTPDSSLEKDITTIITILFCIFGFIANGTVIWLLGFCIKRNQFTTYILNLSIADTGLLTANFITEIHWMAKYSYDSLLCDVFDHIFYFTYNTGQFLLTAISIDRCVCVLFPILYRCHRPQHLTRTICALIWGLSSLSPGIHLILHLNNLTSYNIVNFQLIVSGLLCLPLMTISTLILFIKVYFKPRQRRRGKLIVIILLALLFFIVFSFPLNAFYIADYIFHSETPLLAFYGFLCASLNSSVNPFIYFLVGRKKRGRPITNMKAILQNAFRDEENSPEEEETTAETQL
ncbi:proto-oncogene Mas-like [Lacerta agilis]|uniref:proto-oncogene Mas-like n=1 Tax=Lacerta agilis TaxID=80427 RepID=UPI001419D603|nr:proto-oncogene Mas-like [Lacerta agilis]